jgi:hypothetical protein
MYQDPAAVHVRVPLPVSWLPVLQENAADVNRPSVVMTTAPFCTCVNNGHTSTCMKHMKQVHLRFFKYKINSSIGQVACVMTYHTRSVYCSKVQNLITNARAKDHRNYKHVSTLTCLNDKLMQMVPLK